MLLFFWKDLLSIEHFSCKSKFSRTLKFLHQIGQIEGRFDHKTIEFNSFSFYAVSKVNFNSFRINNSLDWRIESCFGISNIVNMHLGHSNISACLLLQLKHLNEMFPGISGLIFAVSHLKRHPISSSHSRCKLRFSLLLLERHQISIEIHFISLLNQEVCSSKTNNSRT